MWPRSWNSRSLRSTTVWPRWMSGVVGSMPSFTRSGRPSAELALELALRQRVDGVAGEESGCLARRVRHGANARLPTARRAPASAPCRAGSQSPRGRPHGRRSPRRRRSQECRSRRRPPSTPPPGAPAVASLARTASPPQPPRPAEAQAEEAAPGARPARASRVLALISTVFGMLMAVASDLPALENQRRVQRARRTRCSTPTCPAARSRTPSTAEIARLTGNQNRILLEPRRDLAQHQERRDRDRGPALLRARGRGLPGHRARALAGHAAPAAPPRAARRSPSSS